MSCHVIRHIISFYVIRFNYFLDLNASADNIQYWLMLRDVAKQNVMTCYVIHHMSFICHPLSLHIVLMEMLLS